MRDDVKYQTVPMKEAIKFLEEGPAGIFCEFQPGNGTRYVIGLTKLFTDSSALECCCKIAGGQSYVRTRAAVGGLLEGGWLVTWLNRGGGGRCCVLQPEGYLSPEYILNIFLKVI